jgi:hypothetical protein
VTALLRQQADRVRRVVEGGVRCRVPEKRCSSSSTQPPARRVGSRLTTAAATGPCPGALAVVAQSDEADVVGVDRVDRMSPPRGRWHSPGRAPEPATRSGPADRRR